MSTILIVDDHPINRELLVTLLGYGGHRLLEAANGAEALAACRAERPDLVITDILMPTMDGFEFVRCLRADPALASLPVVFHTATFRAPEARLLGQACGVTRVLAKPSPPEDILRTVAEMLAPGPSPGAPRPAPAPACDTAGHVLAPSGLRRKQVGGAEAIPGDAIPGCTATGISELAQGVIHLQSVRLRLAAVLEAALDLASQRDPAQLMASFCHAAHTICGSRYAVAVILDGDTLAQMAVHGIEPAEVAALAENPRPGALASVIAENRAWRASAADWPLPSPLPPPRHSWLALPIGRSRQHQGWLCLVDKAEPDGFDGTDELVAMALAAQVATLYENLALFSDLEQRVGERTAALQAEIAERQRVEARIRDLGAHQQAAIEEDRRRIAREIHDELGSHLAVMRMDLNLAAAETGPGKTAERLARTIAEVDTVIGTTRRICSDLRPSLLDNLGLWAAIKWQAAHVRRSCGLACEAILDGSEPEPDRQSAIALFRIIQEAMTNAVRHAGAAHLTIEPTLVDHQLVIVIDDDGRGIRPDELLRGNSFGILGMGERARALGGSVDVEGGPGGTRVTVKMPLRPEAQTPS